MEFIYAVLVAMQEQLNALGNYDERLVWKAIGSLLDFNNLRGRAGFLPTMITNNTRSIVMKPSLPY